MKRILSVLCIGLLLFLVVGCGETTTTDEAVVADDEEITTELIGTWEVKDGDTDITLEFKEDGEYTETRVTGDKTEEIVGTYTEFDGALTLSPTTVDGQDEEAYVAANNITEEDMTKADYVFNSVEASITIDGDTMNYISGETNLDFTKTTK